MSLQSAKMMALMGVMAAMANPISGGGIKKVCTSLPTKQEVDEKKRQSLLKKGYKEFTVNGEKILALSEKKAIEKYNKTKNR
jgi:inorganic pyrophosphatase/exopolyphosphatase